MLHRAQVGLAAILGIVLLVSTGVSALPVSAQATAPVIQTADLRLWPEYDDPGLLVVLAGKFADGTQFPLQVSFPVPAGARNVQATYQDASGALINKSYEIKDGNLTYELPSAGFQIEYYLDRTPSGDQRNVDYSFVAPYVIKTLREEVQEPARSTGFNMTPAGESSQQGADGLTYHVFNRSNLTAGERLDTKISYSKTDSGLSAPQLAVAQTSTTTQPAAAPASASATAPTTNLLPWLLIGLGVALLVGILAYWLISRQRQPVPQPVSSLKPAGSRAKATQATPRAAAVARPAAEVVSFCTNCGHGLKAEDRFCSQCGAPRRS
jgi:hypothetical protein